MSQFDKLLQRINSLDKNMRFDELRNVLESYGYTISGPGSGSSHKKYSDRLGSENSDYCHDSKCLCR